MENQPTDSQVDEYRLAAIAPTHKQVLDHLRQILCWIGDDPDREGLLDTPNRILKSWQTLYAGYWQEPADILATSFKEGSCDEMVVLRDIEMYSTCEHHMLPFHGRAHVAYIPNEKVVGISKLARLVDCFSRRLQIQERLTSQVADAIQEHLQPKGSIVIIEAQHFCMTSRGVEKQNSVMMTSAIRGVFKDQCVRDEFLTLIKRG